MKSHTATPRIGEKATYLNRPEWRWYQKYLPTDLRIEGDALPQEQWWEWSGHMIHVDRYIHSHPQAKMILLHGGGGNGRVLGPFARMAQRAGCEVIAPDLPGYGLTVRARALRPSYALWCDIASSLINAERERDGLPVFVWGLSIGGLLAYLAAAQNRRVSGVIATTLADTRRLATMAQIGKNRLVGGAGYLLLKAFGPLLDGITVPMKWLSPMKLISNDPDISAVFIRDRLAGGSAASIRFLRSLINLRPAAEPERFDVCPVLLAHPAIDPWTPLELSTPFYDRLIVDKELVRLDGCGHFPVEDPGRRQLERAVGNFVKRIVDAV